MARAIATVGGIALAPGISKNRRLYTPDLIGRMVAKAQARLSDGGAPLTMLTHHAAEDDSTRVVGRVTSLTFDEKSGVARYTAEIADTPHGRTIADLADTTDGKPAFLRGVSIRAAWTGGSRVERGPDGDPVETGDELELDGLDYTRKPGVAAAGIDTFKRLGTGASRETSGRVPVTESVEEALVTITEPTAPEAAAASGPVRAAFEAAYPAPAHAFAGGLCVTCPATEADKSKPYGAVAYADPGYQADKKARYPIDTKAHAKAAWSYVNQADNAKAYTAAQLKRVKARIVKALKKFGVSVAAEGWTVDSAVRVDEAVAECYPMDAPGQSGSWSINATNGPVSLNLSSYGMDPADLDVILRAAADAACQALKALDPDMDGDIDVPGADAEDTDGDAGEDAPPEADPAEEDADESAPEPAGEASQEIPAPDPAAGETAERTDAAMSESTTPAAETTAAPALTKADIDAAVAAALEADRAARRARKAAKRPKPAESAPAAPVAEAAPAAPAAPAAVQETEEQMIERLVAARLAEAFPQESAEDRITRVVQERFDAAHAAMIQSGQAAPSRKGVVRQATETGAGAAESLNPATGLPASWGETPLHQMSQESFDRFTGPVVVRHVLGDRADRLQ